ncbi:MAG: transporter substrate-binding domain-containing protein [Rhodospirillaceae bacterium]
MVSFARLLPFAALAGLSVLPSLVHADSITLRADEWCPYNCAAGSDKPGYGIEIVKEIFAKAGHTIEYGTEAWARALEECGKGTVVAVIGAARKDAPTFVYPESHYGIADNSFVVRKGNPWRLAGVESLEKLKVGIIQGYAYDGTVGDYLTANLANKARTDVVGGDNALELNLKKVVAGRVDTTVDAMAVLSYKINQLGIADKLEMAGTTDQSLIYVAFSPGHPKAREYAKLFDEGLAGLRASGRLKQILDRYNLKDWQ